MRAPLSGPKKELSYFAAGEGLAYGLGDAFFVVEEDFAAGLAGVAGLAPMPGLVPVAGLAGVAGLAFLCDFLCLVVAFFGAGLEGVSAKATMGSAAHARISSSFFMSVFPSSGSVSV